ncbi:MAG: hypothetical protein ABFD64_09150 [Armatimonadota bacterium]
MKEFCQLISILIALAGFLVVAAVLLVRGESLLIAAFKSVLVFAALWAVQSVLRTLISFAVGSSEKAGSDEQ